MLVNKFGNFSIMHVLISSRLSEILQKKYGTDISNGNELRTEKKEQVQVQQNFLTFKIFAEKISTNL